MEKKERLANTHLLLLLPAGILAASWAIYGFPYSRFGVELIALAVITVFFSSYFRIQLPRTKIHVTISDAMIMLSLLIYGGEFAVIVSILETAYTSFSLRRKGLSISFKTALINVFTGAIAVFATTQIVLMTFGSPVAVFENGDKAALFWLLAVMCAAWFLVDSIIVSAVVATRCGKSVMSVWNDNCVNALVIYISGAALAGLAAMALKQVNVILFVTVAGFFALIYMIYRRYVDDIKQTSEKAENSERQRAEQAENYVMELEHYVSQLEATGRELKQSREKFRHAAYHDALTGLPNRNYFIDTLQGLLDKAKTDSTCKFAVLFLDLNRFRTINDSLGHSTGDRLIRHVAKRLSEMTGEGDLVGHFGGDEFAFILTEAAEIETATHFADRVAKRIAESFRFNGRQVFTTVSVGIAFGSQDYQKSEDVLRDADIAMYYAKDNEENYVIFDKTMHTRAVSLQQLETDLRYAIVSDELELFYQPIVELNTVSLSGFEALVRWNHPTRGLIAPNEFISVSEDSGLVIPMTLQILRTACTQMVEWQNRSADNRSLSISVNLSGKHFSQPDLVGQVMTIVSETKINPNCLKLEITESVVMENAENAIFMLKQIRDIGVRLSVDDFGTGYSSLSYLHRFPIDTLKIDRSFVSSMTDGDGENAEIVHTIIALARALKLSVVAEGIETVEQLDQLRTLGCEFGQGYLLSRPVPVAQIEKLLDDKSLWDNLTASAAHAAAVHNYDPSQLGISH